MEKIFNRPWLYTDLLLKICDILDYDFFKCYTDWRKEKEKEKTMKDRATL